LQFAYSPFSDPGVNNFWKPVVAQETPDQNGAEIAQDGTEAKTIHEGKENSSHLQRIAVQGLQEARPTSNHVTRPSRRNKDEQRLVGLVLKGDSKVLRWCDTVFVCG